ncbi:ABC transporter substrate-binding protein [Priestia megaterium]|uniref:peptide ABC transporter substrate-binding protein n=1 Tax=Priestia TaxID=2800373 RepID=UPI00211B959D|nr:MULTISPECIES: peptide ABC transporter substrate-binding protein [Priestia]MCQ9282760.1 peptide ABC transporter substrate-binding protein [Priestia aryabhattai]WKU23160.1 peptide ABC transporter substrate-binding protein [Priestia megaterium]
MKKRLSILFSLLLVMSLFLAACGFNKESGGSSSGGDDSGKAKSQDLRVNIKTEPFSLNPGLANDSVSGAVLRQTFEGLTRLGKDGKPEEAMAKKIDVSDDGLVYTFKLRDAKWSNGDPVIAKDFEYAWKWALDAKNESQYAEQLYYIKGGEAANKGTGSMDDVGIKAVDDKTLQVTLEHPTTYFLELTAFYTYYPVDSKVVEKNPKWYTNAGDNYVTNGPFKMTQWKHNDKIVLKPSENYWDKDAVKLKNIEMYMINDNATELSMFEKGELDWAGNPAGQLPQDAIPQLKDKGNLNVNVKTGTYMYKFNTEDKALSNANVRKALAYAIDRKAIVENVTKAEQVPATAMVPAQAYGEKKNNLFKDNDVKKAKELLNKGLKEMGLSKLPPIKISYNTDEGHQKVAQAVQDMWKKNLGVDVQLNNQEWNVYIDELNKGNFQIGRMGWIADFNDPITFLEMFEDKNGGNNNTFWENPKYQQLLDQSRKEQDPKKRYDILKQAEKILMTDMPAAPIYYYTDAWVQDENLKDVVMSSTGDIQFKWAHFK